MKGAPSVHAEKLKDLLPCAMLEIEQRRFRAEEDARKKEEWEQSRLLCECEQDGKDLSRMHDRLDVFESQLQCKDHAKHRLIRNRHLLLPSRFDLSAAEAREEMARDPGLLVEGDPEGGMCSLVRWDAGCASCGRAFELAASGNPLKERDVPSNQLSLLDVASSPMLETLAANQSQDEPHGVVRCPHCGRASKLDYHASELVVMFDWPMIAIGPSRASFSRDAGILGLPSRIAPDWLGVSFDLAEGEAWQGLLNVARFGLRPEAARRFDEYPIAEAIVRLLRENGVDATRIARQLPLSINGLIEALGRF